MHSNPHLGRKIHTVMEVTMMKNAFTVKEQERTYCAEIFNGKELVGKAETSFTEKVAVPTNAKPVCIMGIKAAAEV